LSCSLETFALAGLRTTTIPPAYPTRIPQSHAPFLLDRLKIGRKHKQHRQELQQGRPWRNAEKGRKGKNKGKGRRGNMGQDESRMVDDNEPPQTLESRTLESIAGYIKDGRATRIVVMVCLALAIATGCANNAHRPAQASAPRLVSQTFGLQILASTRISLASTYPTPKPSSISAFSARTPFRFTPSPRSSTLAGIGLPSHTRLSLCCIRKACCLSCLHRILTVWSARLVCQRIRSSRLMAALRDRAALTARCPIPTI